MYHGPLDGGDIEVDVVGQALLIPVRSTPVLLVARLVEIRV